MSFRKSQKGAVTVFLTLVLIPVMIFSFLATDVARIYSAKVVASDAGELAMNAALAQYDADLFDQYGLLAMKNTPGSMNETLEQCFNSSLCSSGITGYEDMLGLVEESFKAIAVENTEIFRSDVEKQQIIEYMKYRAPVCLTELVLEKFKFIKDSEKQMDAINKELDFAESMEECQDSFENAYKTLKSLSEIIEAFPTQQELQDAFSELNRDLTREAAKAFLMRAALEYYKDVTNNNSVEDDMESFVNEVSKIDLNNPTSDASYNAAIAAKHYKSHVDFASQTNGFVDKTDEYKTAEGTFNSYLNSLEKYAKDIVEEDVKLITSAYEKVKLGKSLSKTASIYLNDIREALNKAKTSYEKWDDAVGKLDDEAAGSMKAEVEEYAPFFRDNMEDLSNLQMHIDDNFTYFDKIQQCFEKLSMCETKIVLTPVAQQNDKYYVCAKNAISSVRASGAGLGTYSIETISQLRTNAFVNTFVIPDVETGNYTLYHVINDPFYLRLEEYCQKNNSEDSETKANETNKKLNEGSNAAHTIEDDIEVLTYSWESATQDLPSIVLGFADFTTQASSKYTNIESNNNIKDKKKRKSLIKKAKESIGEATSFLNGLDRLLEDNLENLYVAEYAMQMFSHYSCDKTMNKDKSLADVTPVSISGYSLENNKAYRAEIEYILWGNSSSAVNVLNTFELLFGVRLLFDSIYAFTNVDIKLVAEASALAIAPFAPYLVPVIKTAVKLGLALAETATDITMLKQGYGVGLMKTTTDNNFVSFPSSMSISTPDVRNGVTFDYGEYLRVFLNVSMMAGKEDKILSRIGDCIQVNTNSDILTEFTMVSVESQVGVKTNFIRKISDWASANWDQDSTYTIDYQSVLAY